MLVKLDEECCEVGHVDDPDHVSLARGNVEGSGRIVIDYS